MKRWAVLCGALLLILFGVLLGRTAIDPADYTGEWYSYETQRLYCFQNGLIYSPKHGETVSDALPISGAYAFGRNRIFLFVEGISGLESEKQIYLVKHGSEHILCENKDGSGQIYFVRMIEKP